MLDEDRDLAFMDMARQLIASSNLVFPQDREIYVRVFLRHMMSVQSVLTLFFNAHPSLRIPAVTPNTTANETRFLDNILKSLTKQKTSGKSQLTADNFHRSNLYRQLKQAVNDNDPILASSCVSLIKPSITSSFTWESVLTTFKSTYDYVENSDSLSLLEGILAKSSFDVLKILFEEPDIYPVARRFIMRHLKPDPSDTLSTLLALLSENERFEILAFLLEKTDMRVTDSTPLLKLATLARPKAIAYIDSDAIQMLVAEQELKQQSPQTTLSLYEQKLRLFLKQVAEANPVLFSDENASIQFIELSYQLLHDNSLLSLLDFSTPSLALTSVKYIAPAKAQANTYAIPDPLTQDLMYLKLYPHGVIGTATSPDALHDKQVSYSGRTLSLLYPKTDKSKAGNPLIHRYHGAENKASKRNASVRVSEHSLSMKAAKANQHFYPVSVRYTTNSDKQRETGFFGHAQIVGEVRPVETTPVYDAFATGGCIIGGDLMAVSAQGERFSLTDPKTTFPANFAAATIHYDDEPHTYERYNEAMLKKLLNFVSAVRTPQAVFYYESPVIYYMIYGLTHYLRGVLSFELFTQYIDIVKKHHRWITERLEYFSLHFDINIVVTSVLDGLMISDLNPEEILKAFNDLAATPPLPLSQEQYQKYAQTLVSAIIDKLAKGTDEMATLHQYIQTQRAQQPDFLGKSGNPLVDLNRTSYAGLYAWIRLVTKKQVPNPELLVIVPQDETHILETYNLFSKHFGGLTAMAYSPLLMPQTDSKLFYLTKGKGLLNALIKKLVSLQGKMVSSMALDSPTAYAHYTEEIEKLLTSFTPNSVKPPAKPTSQHFSPRPFTPYHSVSSLHQDLTQEASTPRRIQLDIVPSPQTFRQLEQCLFLPSCPDAFSLVFSTPLNESSFNALMTLLQIQGHEKTFFLRFTSISDEQLRLLHTVLMTGKSSVSGIELRNYAGVSPPVTKDEYTDEGLRYLANALSSGHCAPDFALEIHAHQNITPRSYFYIHQALAAHAPKRLKLLVDSPDNDVANINELYTLLAGGLNNPKSLEVLELDIQTNDLPTQGLTALANALTSGQCPQTLCLRFRLRERENPSMRQETIIRLLSDQNTPPANTASYFQQGLTAFIKALSSEQCPKDLTLDFSALDLDETRYQQLLHCLRDIKSDKKLTLLLGKASYMDDRALEMLTEVLANNPDLPMLSISLKGDFTDEALIRMTDQLKTGPFRHPLTLKLDTQHTSFACQRQCFNALKTVSNLQIDIESSFSKKDIPFIEEQLSAGIYPQGFKDALAHFSTRTREKLEQLCDAYQHNLPEDKSAPLLKHVLLNEYYKATVNAWKTAKPNYAAFFKAEESKKNPPISVEHNANKSV